MAQIAIRAQELSKRYRLGEGGYATLREKLDERIRSRSRRTAAAPGEVWALRDVDLEIGEGEIVGIVGRNGSGKTTFLKTVARIVRPTTGSVAVRGRVGALLEVGTGFHPELTGRENVFLNGVVLGMSRREVARRFDEIVEFAGVERFLETPLKRYSSGMYLRLAFAVAAHIDPDVLIVDEVLAVGDAEFQRRCLGRISELGRDGRTVLFVSHDAGTVGRLCGRAVWLDQGRVKGDGPAHDILSRYLEATVPGGSQASVPGRPNTPIRELSVALIDEHGDPVTTLRRDEPLSVRLDCVTTERTLGLDVAIYLVDARGTRILSENLSDAHPTIGGPPQEFTIDLTIPPLLRAGDYMLGVWLGTETESFFYQELLSFTLLPRPDERDESVRRERIVQPLVDWRVGTSRDSGTR